MGKNYCQPVVEALMGRRFSHRNPKLHFSIGKICRHPSEQASPNRNVSHKKVKTHISVGSLAVPAAKSPAHTRSNTHRTLKIHHPMGIFLQQPASPHINALFPIIPHKKISTYNIAKKWDFLQKFRKKNKKKSKIFKNVLL
jgi:hypothetical protein